MQLRSLALTRALLPTYTRAPPEVACRKYIYLRSSHASNVRKNLVSGYVKRIETIVKPALLHASAQWQQFVLAAQPLYLICRGITYTCVTPSDPHSKLGIK